MPRTAQPNGDRSVSEIWKPVPGFNGSHEVSSDGRVRSAKTGRILKQSVQRDSGRLQVGIWREGKSTPTRVHALVALAFHGPRPHGLEIRHLNGNQRDNRPSNLRYGTHAENEQDKLRHGTHNHARKTACKSGHPFDSDNTYIHPTSGQRVCRKCMARHRAAWEAKQRLKKHG